ncbi:MAG: hypothetical protein A3I03_06220 [Candidatus Rokubacteria bacterium RIFCSPLOWO2_02_FULL_68_19]|nr:MAG: hypothetical protein XU13_C0062G0010 [Candidatus Rokubacteria bacterium CSP1-6]OGL06833.1 MAG: hypothetical protein A3I03_06220 [Candidatus Rokubacteria bacterium RIFCSPLOWO2_02_FULL_68_19]
MSETFEGVHYVVIGRRSAHKRAAVENLFQGRPEFRVVVDRRAGERRKSSAVIGSDNRSGIDRRK